MKRQDVLNAAKIFFRDNIKAELRSGAGWSCWDSAALATVAVYLQQKTEEEKVKGIPEKKISYKNLCSKCEFRQLVKFANFLSSYGTHDEVQTILYVCQDRAAHKRFFSIVKECFEDKEGFIPFFGELDEDEQTEEEQKFEQAKICGFADGYSFSKKKFWEGFFVGLGGAALAVVLAACFLKTLTN